MYSQFSVCSCHVKFVLMTTPRCLLLCTSYKGTASVENTRVLPISSWRFRQKMQLEASQAVFWALLCYKGLTLTTKPFTGRTLRSLLIQMQNISLRSLGMCRKQNFEVFISGHLVGFFLVGKALRKAFRILGLGK